MNEKEKNTFGLSAEEVRERIRAGRVNKASQKGSLTAAGIIRHNILNLFNLINIALAVLVLLCGSPKNALFMGVVFSNALIGSFQELRAKRMTDRLTLLSGGKVRLIRDGEEILTDREEMVEDDVFLPEAGDQIPVDGVVLEGSGQVNESLLTGESDPVEKNPGDSLLSGSFLISGRLTVRASAVGNASYAARMTAEAKKYKKPVSQISRTLNIIICTAMGVIPILGGFLFWKQLREGIDLSDAVIHTVASVIGMIPSGLVLLSTGVLCIGAVRLGKKNALVREYACIETLARVDTVCMDKTGTLTKGKMEALEPIVFEGVSKERAVRAITAFVTASNDRNPTVLCLRETFPLTFSIPAIEKRVDFSSQLRYSAVRFAEEKGNLPRTLLLGAAERLCPDLAGMMKDCLEACYCRGERVVVLAESDEDLPSEGLPVLTPLAFFPLKDTLRSEVGELLKELRQNGVEIKLISGDAPETVEAIAAEAKLESKGLIDLSELPEGKEEEIAEAYSVFGRVSPEQKCRLIKALKKNHTVAMVGDGVNDVPALHQADVSVAMAGGSRAASDVSKIVLLDGDFTAMREVIYEGRRAVNNVERTATLYLGKTFYTMLLTLILIFAPGKYPFQPIQLTLISMFTIGLPSVVLGLEKNRELIKGRFLPDVLRTALPASLILLGSILAGMLCGGRLLQDPVQASTLTVMAAANAGLTVLVYTARPWGKRHALLVAGMALGLYGCTLLLYDFLSLAALPWYAVLFLCVLAAAGLLLYPILEKAAKKLLK